VHCTVLTFLGQGLAFVLARAYSLTLMYNVLSRTSASANGTSSNSRTQLSSHRKFNTGTDSDPPRVHVDIPTLSSVELAGRDNADRRKSEEAGSRATTWV
jgi:hypothetical protein